MLSIGGAGRVTSGQEQRSSLSEVEPREVEEKRFRNGDFKFQSRAISDGL